MKHYKFGYARVSTEQQNLARQLDMLTQYGVDYIFNEKMTGTKRDRPELNKLLDRMMEGDTVVIESLSRLGRSTKDLIELVELFRERADRHLHTGRQAAVYTDERRCTVRARCDCRAHQRGLRCGQSTRPYRRQTAH